MNLPMNIQGNNKNIDIKEAFLDSLNLIKQTKVGHICVYSLCVESGSHLFDVKKYRECQFPLPDNNNQADLYEKCHEVLEDQYLHYEVSSFLRKDCDFPIHNPAYWKENISNKEFDLEGICENNVYDQIENILLGRLRTSFGVDLVEIKNLFGDFVYNIIRERVKGSKGFLICDEIITDLSFYLKIFKKIKQIYTHKKKIINVKIRVHNYRPISASQIKKSQLPEPQGDIEEYMEILLEHQINCQKQGKYVEAELAKRRLQELKVEFEKRSKDEMKQRHYNEKSEIEKAHLNEYNEFNEFWDKKMQEFNEEAERVEKETLQRHQEELEKFQEEIEQSISQKPKDTPELLNLRKMEEQLARQQEYMEAHQIQQRIFILEKEEFEKWNYQRQIKVKNLMVQLRTRQQNEISALRQRIISGQEEQKKSEIKNWKNSFKNIIMQKKNLKILKYKKVLKWKNHQNMDVYKQYKYNNILFLNLLHKAVMNASKIMNQSKMSNASFAKNQQRIQY
ncbi:oxygen-independent coproporphyrinogen iii family protein, putative [Ichthyophthirius multifiliis]|uniref:Oxygen-independent coproporphyrinogen iii family protein, putative n=1 Tax=Ichthyophthirius multifiliis TaxID=5932 RepID=G0QZ82_ICHMU|nr:oxygen-independent coproporphyrinogen iii family protein, putative [Ichthyophthirius multifiliis]EGR29465.1 oxygen-independent coproporphyrinogen iii family protein, putative [Ichthyophthirius multifiliis]|eukprot:XP_004030701.1 oxygen-independent coproporphyrinogen iii family protein, putative [Ichthyophthirius multifiliis]